MRIEHIAIYVNDLEKAKDFYVKYFDAKPNEGFHNEVTDLRTYFLTFEDGARLELMNRPDMTDTEKQLFRTGFTHLAISVGSREKVDELTKTICNDGYEHVSGPRVTGDGYYESCIKDPEGNTIEITI